MRSFFQRLMGASSQTKNGAAANGRPCDRQRRIRKRFGADRVGIVGFHEKGFVVARPADPHASWLQERIQTLHTRLGGPTNLTDGLRTAVAMCEKTPPGILRRIWLLSDGYPNREAGGIGNVLAFTRRQRVNVNTVGFGDVYDERLLRQISQCTHNGKFVPVRTMQELTEALVRDENNGHGRHKRRHQAETTIVAIDLSASMTELMEGRTKIQVVQQVLLQLLLYKQRCYA